MAYEQIVFINLPVTDLARSIAFYEGIGARRDAKYSNDVAAAMVLSDTINVMLLSHSFYAGFTTKPIADAHATSQVILCLSHESRAAVDATVASAAASGGTPDVAPKQEMGAMMYGRSFADPDGHHWEAMWMATAAEDQITVQAAAAFEAQGA